MTARDSLLAYRQRTRFGVTIIFDRTTDDNFAEKG